MHVGLNNRHQVPGLGEGVNLMCCAKGGMVSIQEKEIKIIFTQKRKEKDKDGISPAGGVTWVVFIFTLVNAILLGPI